MLKTKVLKRKEWLTFLNGYREEVNFLGLEGMERDGRIWGRGAAQVRPERHQSAEVFREMNPHQEGQDTRGRTF